MISNLEKYKDDLNKLIKKSRGLLVSMEIAFYGDEYLDMVKDNLNKRDVKIDKFLKELPSFKDEYQSWYSEGLVLLKQLLPVRVSDFTKLYEKPKTTRKEITHENYVIEDALQGLQVNRQLSNEKIVGSDSSIPRFKQQINIIESINRRFESSLFDIKQLVQADLFDSELEAAKELNKKGFMRGAGAIAGVVLESHLFQVCDNHQIKIAKKNPSISDYNDKLKEVEIYETPIWRKIQHLGDLRNLCDHNKKEEPKVQDVEELIQGVENIIKTIF